jgi:Arc/MetJ-type ribon-helix-helix transcriptional regulator
MDFPDDLEVRLNRLVEAGYFKSREEAVLKATAQLLERLDPDGQPVAKDRLDIEGLFRRNQAYFEQQKETLQKKYGDVFVAVWEERVVDHDADRPRLAERVYKRFGSVPIYIDQPSVSLAGFYVSSPTVG